MVTVRSVSVSTVFYKTSFSLVFKHLKACCVSQRSGNQVSEEYSISLPFRNSWVAFGVCFGSLSLCTLLLGVYLTI